MAATSVSRLSESPPASRLDEADTPATEVAPRPTLGLIPALLPRDRNLVEPDAAPVDDVARIPASTPVAESTPRVPPLSIWQYRPCEDHATRLVEYILGNRALLELVLDRIGVAIVPSLERQVIDLQARLEESRSNVSRLADCLDSADCIARRNVPHKDMLRDHVPELEHRLRRLEASASFPDSLGPLGRSVYTPPLDSDDGPTEVETIAAVPRPSNGEGHEADPDSDNTPGRVAGTRAKHGRGGQPRPYHRHGYVQTPPRARSPHDSEPSPRVLAEPHSGDLYRLLGDVSRVQVAPPYPDHGGPYAIIRGSHFIDVSSDASELAAHGAHLWGTRCDSEIRSIFSPGRCSEIGEVNQEQRALVAAAQRVPERSRSDLQRLVIQWGESIYATSNHAAIPEAIIVPGIRRGSNTVWNPIDLYVHRFLLGLEEVNLKLGIPTTYVQRVMQLIRDHIFAVPGRYSDYVAQIEPGVSANELDDLETATFFRFPNAFNAFNFSAPEAIQPVDVATYLRSDLKVPRRFGRCLESFCRRSARQEVAMQVWRRLVIEEAMTMPKSEFIFGIIPESTAFKNLQGPEDSPYDIEYHDLCGDNAQVRYRMPTRHEALSAQSVDAHTDWIPELVRDQFLQMYHGACTFLTLDPVSD